MQRKNYTEFDTEFVILDKRGKNCTRFGLGAPLSGGRPCCGGRFGGHFGRPPEMGGIWRLCPHHAQRATVRDGAILISHFENLLLKYGKTEFLLSFISLVLFIQFERSKN